MYVEGIDDIKTAIGKGFNIAFSIDNAARSQVFMMMPSIKATLSIV